MSRGSHATCGSSLPRDVERCTPALANRCSTKLAETRPIALGSTCSIVGEPPRATLEVKQTKLVQMAEGGRYEFEYTFNVKPGSTAPKTVSVDIIGIKDIRIIDMKPSPTGGGTFVVTTTKATDFALYDMYGENYYQSGERRNPQGQLLRWCECWRDPHTRRKTET